MEEESRLNITFSSVSVDSPDGNVCGGGRAENLRPYFKSFSVVKKREDMIPLASAVTKRDTTDRAS